jgi:hypothetical protein
MHNKLKMLQRHTFKVKKPVFRLFMILCLFLAGISVVKAQSEPPRMLTLEHGQARLFDAYLLEKGADWAHNAVHPRLLPTAYRNLQQDTVYNRSRFAGKWWHKKAFSTHLLAAEKPASWGIEADVLLDVSAGREFVGGDYTSLNTRGARLQGYIGSRIAFSTELYENQANLPFYLDSFVRQTTIMPGQGIARTFNGTTWDFVNAQSYIAYQANQYIHFQVGQGRHFLGNGYRSLLLSDAAFPAPFLRMQAQFGQVQYTYWIHQLTDIYAPMLSPTMGFRQKYNAMGYLSWKASKRFELGVFQSVVWQADDPNAGRRSLPWQYLNPIIFFHPIQFSSGSEGNLLLGLNTQYRLGQRSFVYAQFVLDELRVRDFLSQNGAAANKYGGQLGIKGHQAFGVKGLFLQTEVNMVRPHTYTHWSSLTNYGHYGQSLAHPAGANFREWLMLADYRMPMGWFLQSKVVYIQQGLDSAGINFGSNVNQSYLTAPGSFNAKDVWILQGRRSDLWHLEVLFGKVLNPKTNLQIEARCILRRQETDLGARQTAWFTLGLRSALRNLYTDF